MPADVPTPATAAATAADRPPRYVVGIDLGTTNCALAFVDTGPPGGDAAGGDRQTPGPVTTWPVPQFVAPGTLEGREALPSFLLSPGDREFPPGSLTPPWGGNGDGEVAKEESEPAWVAGTFARDHGAKAPGRQVGSAKSWLCHPGVDRTADLLPWHAAEGVEKLSPVDASAVLLRHMRLAWDAAHAGFPLAAQDVVLTLPASFDEVARELTVRAARAAGLPRVVLIEEPQAAFYAWLTRHPDDWHARVRPGTNVLVCDIGGGTSDFTLIRVKPASPSPTGGASGGKIVFHRVAVGEHLILGGDNLDLALAHHLEAKLKDAGTELTPRQWDVLVRQSRRAKETLLGDAAPETVTVTLPGAGSKLLGGGLRVAADRDAARAALLGGFLPDVPVSAVPDRREAGFRELGLPYAPDAAITKHLAYFLTRHGAVAGAEDGRPAKPDAVLFNGGFFASPVLRDTLLDRIADWFGDAGWRPDVLEHDRLDLAVSRGAAYFGLVRRGLGVRVEAGLARTYYLGAEAGDGGETNAVCVVPAGTRPGETVALPDTPVRVRVGQPVELPVFSSGVRLTDPPGSVHPVDDSEFHALPPIRTVLRAKGRGGEELPAVIEAGLSEIGTLDLFVRERGDDAAKGKRWRLSFDVRSTTRTDLSAHAGGGEAGGVLDDAALAAAAAVLDAAFGSPDGAARPTLEPRDVPGALEEAVGLTRDDWPTTFLRSLWESLLDREAGRRESPAREARWANLLGYALRPGYGLALDDWRVAETWRALHGKLVHADPACVSQWLILWRRVCGGLEAGQQRALAEPLAGSLRSLSRGKAARGKGGGKKKRTAEPADDPEAVRLLGSLERLPVTLREEFGRAFLTLAAKEPNDGRRAVLWWAAGRTGGRVPLYGPANGVVPASVAADWADELMSQSAGAAAPPIWPVVQIARRTGDRFLDLPPPARDRVLAWLGTHDAPAHWVELVRTGGALDTEEAGLAFGESLPAGLRLG